LSPEARAGPGGFGASHRERPTRISDDAIDLGRSGSPRLIVRSLDFARDDRIFSKNKFCQFSDIYIQEVKVAFKASFCFEIICLLCVPSRGCGTG